MSKREELIKKLQEDDRKAELISKLKASESPEVSVAPDAEGFARDVKQGFEEYVTEPLGKAASFVGRQLERPAAGLRSGISTMANLGEPIQAASNSLRGFINPEQAPTPAETLEDVGVPRKVAQNPLVNIPADMLMDPFLFGKGASKALGKLGEVSKLSKTAAEKNYGKLKSMAGHSDAAINRLEQNKNNMVLALSESDIENNLRRPNELKRILSGRSLGVSDVVDEVADPISKIDAADFIQGGKISKLGKEVDAMIADTSAKLQNRGFSIRGSGIADIVWPQKLREFEMPGSGIDKAQYDKIVKVAERYRGSLLNKSDITLEDLHRFKKKLGENLTNKDFLKQAASDPTVSLEKDVLTEMYVKTKGLIVNLADKVKSADGKGSAGEELDFLNRKMQAYYTIDSILTKPASRQVMLTSQGFPVGDAASAVAKTAGGAALGSQMFGFGGKTAGLAGAAVGARMSKPELTNISDYLKYTIPPGTGENLMQTQMYGRQAFPMDQGRSPDGVGQDAQSYNFKRVKSLMSQPLPRSSDELISNKAARDMLISKTYHMVGPEAAGILERQFDMFQPAQLKPALQKFMTDNPSLFDADDYNRVDGIITDDLMIQKAVSDIRKREGMDSVQKARTINAVLNRKPNVRW